MEIEAKFSITDPGTFDTLLQLESLGPFTLRSGGEEQQTNTYFDTADRKLRAARHSLRLRQLADRCLATVKGPGSYASGVHQREEWEVETASVDLAQWPEGNARQAALSIVGASPLFGLFVIRTRRRLLIASQGENKLAELCLDESEIHAGPRTATFSELEAELLPKGPREAFDALIEELRRRFPLVPEPRTKYQRGLALLGES